MNQDQNVRNSIPGVIELVEDGVEPDNLEHRAIHRAGQSCGLAKEIIFS